LTRASHPLRDPKLDDCADAYRLLLERGIPLGSGWQAWRLGMTPNRHAREVMGVPVPAAPTAGEQRAAGTRAAEPEADRP
jgi:hypothetical protein